MNKWKVTFIFLTGFQLCHLLTHIWLGLDNMLPLTSKLLKLTPK